MAFPAFSRRQFTASLALPVALPSLNGYALSHLDLDEVYQAYCVAFPVFEFARTGWAAAAPSALRVEHRYNRMVYQQKLSDERNRTVTTPNRDTLYATARLDVSNGPVLVQIPSITDRYFSVAFMNAFTDNFAYFGTRATGGRGGLALVAGPDWQGRTPAGTTLIRSETRDVWLLARAHVAGPADQTAALEAIGQIVIAEAPEPVLLPAVPTHSGDVANVLTVANAMLARCSPSSIAKRNAHRFAEFGLQPGSLEAWQRLDPGMQESWEAAATRARQTFQQGFARGGPETNGWRYPPQAIGSVAASWELRAGVALSGLGALEQVEATYARTDVDARGEPLVGTRHYRLEMRAGVPAKAFWSVTLYVIEDDGRLFFHANPAKSWSVGSRSPETKVAEDGGVAIVIGPTPPQDPLANWLPSPNGRLALVFRAYLPDRPLLNGDWLLPGARPA